MTGFVWLVGRRSIEALGLPVRSLKGLIGKIGEAHTDIFAEGSVYIDGEEWSGHSEVFIPAGKVSSCPAIARVIPTTPAPTAGR